MLRGITREAAGLARVQMCSLLLLDETGEWLELRAEHGAGEDYRQCPALSTAESLMGSVVRRQKPMQVLNVQTRSLYQHPETARREGLVSMLSAPLVNNAQCRGTLNVYTDAPHVFSNEEVKTLCALAELAVAIEKAELYERTVDVEEQLRRNEQLSALGLLAAEVAHEIRNPLTVMKMLYYLLGLEFDEGDPRREDARVLGEKMDHLDSIVDNIVNFARNAEPRLSPVELPALIDDLALLTRHKLQHQGIQLLREDASEPAIRADATQLSQAFLNLILNAAEAMPEAAACVFERRSGRRHGGGLCRYRHRPDRGAACARLHRHARAPLRPRRRPRLGDRGEGGGSPRRAGGRAIRAGRRHRGGAAVSDLVLGRTVGVPGVQLELFAIGIPSLHARAFASSIMLFPFRVVLCENHLAGEWARLALLALKGRPFCASMVPVAGGSPGVVSAPAGCTVVMRESVPPSPDSAGPSGCLPQPNCSVINMTAEIY